MDWERYFTSNRIGRPPTPFHSCHLAELKRDICCNGQKDMRVSQHIHFIRVIRRVKVYATMGSSPHASSLRESTQGHSGFLNA